ncbi:MAG: AIR carboxylase family protein [Patescibacteria group bacterium]|nr:AIR carboxylase family protein [Patescibacteria group bacterium]
MIAPIIMGSESDRPHAEKITAKLDELGVPSKIYVASAHKVPEKVLEILKSYEDSTEPVCYITIAGRSNALSGFVAANSHFPVIACPPFADKDDFTVNINSTLQMPSDTPVLTVLDPKNTAIAVARIFGLADADLLAKNREYISNVKSKF